MSPRSSTSGQEEGGTHSALFVGTKAQRPLRHRVAKPAEATEWPWLDAVSGESSQRGRRAQGGYLAEEHVTEPGSSWSGRGEPLEEQELPRNRRELSTETKMWGEDSSREEGGTALTDSLELESRREEARKSHDVERQVPQFSTDPREKAGRDHVGKGGSGDPLWEPRDLTGNLLDLLEQLLTGSSPRGSELASGLLHLSSIRSPMCTKVNKNVFPPIRSSARS